MTSKKYCNFDYTLMQRNMEISKQLASVIRDIPDFPKEGIIFKDISPVMQQPSILKNAIDAIVSECKNLEIDAVAGIESRGFLLGIPLALALNVPFVMIRKAGKLPSTTISESYDLEYGSATIEMHQDSLPKGAKVLIHDDVLATGGTAIAAAKLINQIGTVSGFSFLMDLEFLGGKKAISQYSKNISSLISY